MKKVLFILITVILASSIPARAMVKKESRIWQDETIYSIMIDRFYDGDVKNDSNVNTKDPTAYYGGDFQGIIDKLDYIQDMGFTAIKLSPVFDNSGNGYHGYWVDNFYKVEEHFGTMDEFQKLVKEAHKRHMKVLLDFVINNTAKTNPWVTDPDKQDWYHKQSKGDVDWNNQNEAQTAWADGLPDLNQDNPKVKNYLINAAKWWINKTDIDGYTLPEMDLVPVSFWADFSREVKKNKKNFLLMGIPSGKTSFDEKGYSAAGIDSIYNINRSAELRKVFASTDRSFSKLFPTEVNEQNQVLAANFFDNENTSRFTKDIVAERQFPGSRWKTALTYLFTAPGIPVVFYGTEIAQNGGDFPDNLQLMNFRTEKDLIDYITSLGDLRNRLPSLTRGTFKVLYSQKGMTVYKRVYQGETTVVAINNTRNSKKVTLTSKDLEGGKELRGLLGGEVRIINTISLLTEIIPKFMYWRKKRG